MTYWIYVTSFNNWLFTKEKNVLGVSEKYQKNLSVMNIGDEFIIYTKAGKIFDNKIISSIVASYEVISDPYFDDSIIFNPVEINSKEKYPFRRLVKPLTIFDKPRPFKKYVDQLEVIKNKERWGITFMGRALIKISSEDYHILAYG